MIIEYLRNIFLSTDNTVRIGDLGAAKAVEKANVTMTFIGTSRYMSPEQYHEARYSYEVDIW